MWRRWCWEDKDVWLTCAEPTSFAALSLPMAHGLSVDALTAERGWSGDGVAYAPVESRVAWRRRAAGLSRDRPPDRTRIMITFPHSAHDTWHIIHSERYLFASHLCAETAHERTREAHEHDERDMASAVRASLRARESVGWVRPPTASSGAQPPLPRSSSERTPTFYLARPTPPPPAARRLRGAWVSVAAAVSSNSAGGGAAEIASIEEEAANGPAKARGPGNGNQTMAPKPVGPTKRRRGRPKVEPGRHRSPRCSGAPIRVPSARPPAARYRVPVQECIGVRPTRHTVFRCTACSTETVQHIFPNCPQVRPKHGVDVVLGCRSTQETRLHMRCMTVAG